MIATIGHEKLRVYQRALEFLSWSHAALSAVKRSAVVLDHWSRAAESIIENIANGNSRRSTTERNQYFDVALGSALECAACLDICRCRKMITHLQCDEGKRMLLPVANMIVGLRDSRSDHVKEDDEPYAAEGCDRIRFPHEGLEVYQTALNLVIWFDTFLESVDLCPSSATRLDKSTTSLVLNIAESNGRFSAADQMRFIDIAQSCAMRVAAGLDVLVARRQAEPTQVEAGKDLLAQCVPLLYGLRRYLSEVKK